MKFTLYIIISLLPLYLLYLVALYLSAHVPFISTPRRYVPMLFKEVEITPQTVLFDLGCGTGEFLFEAEQYNPKELIGVELSPLHVWYAQVKAKLIKSKVKISRQDFFTTDISTATIVYLFLVKPVLDKAWVKIRSECRSGTVVVTLGDKIDGEKEWKEIIMNPGNPKSSRIRIYHV